MSFVPISRRVTYGEPLPLDGRRATRDQSPGERPMTIAERERDDPSAATPDFGGPATPSEALAQGMREVFRGPNNGAYAMLLDTATNEVVLFGFPVAVERAESLSLAMAPPKVLESDEPERAGTQDAASRAFEARVHHMRTRARLRGLNDANRAHYGQSPVGGGPDRAV